MTRAKQMLTLLVSLIALAAVAPAGSAATGPDPYRYADPSGIRYGSLQPNPYRWAKPTAIRYHSVQPNPLRHVVRPNPLRHVQPKALKRTTTVSPQVIKVRG